MMRRNWTPHEADEWTREDYWAILFSSLAYFLIMVGTALLFLLPAWGIGITAAGTVSAFVMYWIIDPKLRTISLDYEARQKEYLRDLEKTMKWEEK